MRDDCIETLNLLRGGDIYKKKFIEVIELCRTYSRSQAKVGKKLRDLRDNSRDYVQKKTVANAITRVELGNLLEHFKTDVLNTINDQLDTMKIKQKQEVEKAAMALFCSKCRRKHAERECPLNTIKVCGICTLEHPTENFPSLPGLQAIYKGNAETIDQSQATKRPTCRGQS